jgi:hypothetical protein
MRIDKVRGGKCGILFLLNTKFISQSLTFQALEHRLVLNAHTNTNISALSPPHISLASWKMRIRTRAQTF